MDDLNDLREKIDILDHSILESLRDRFSVVNKIGEIKNKKTNNAQEFE